MTLIKIGYPIKGAIQHLFLNQVSNVMFTLLEIKRIILLPKNEYLPKIGNRIMTEPTNCVKLCL